MQPRLRHDTEAMRKHAAGTDPSVYWEFHPGQAVVTKEGLPGVVSAVEDGFVAGNEHYIVDLDHGLGGGQYHASELRVVTPPRAARSTTAEERRAASEDYPVLADILVERPPLERTAKALTARARGRERLGAFIGMLMEAMADEDIQGVVRQLVDQAKREEPQLTRTLQDIAKQRGGEMKGLEYRFKAPDSMERKLRDRVRDRGINDPEALRRSIDDALRYTMVFPPETYSVQVRDSLYSLEERGFPIVDEDNAWSPGPYSALHYTIVTRGGLPVELQFHTDASYKLKNETLHAIYEEFRDNRTQLPRKQELYDLMVSYWDDIEVPEDVHHFPGIKTFQRPAKVVAQEGDAPPFDDGEGETNPSPAKRDMSTMDPEDLKKRWEARQLPIVEGQGFRDRVNDALPTRMQDRPGNQWSFDWCRFRRDQHCYYPKELHERGTAEQGRPVWVPFHRGICPRYDWEAQQECPIGEPGPNSRERVYYPDATVPYEAGGQRDFNPARHDYVAPTHFGPVTGSKEELDPGEFLMHYTAAWADVQQKAKRLRSGGSVRIVSAPEKGTSNTSYIVAEVLGDSGTIYHTRIMRVPGRRQAAMWECGCAWGHYAWGRSGRWKKFEGRMCSHALAVVYEAQSQEGFDGTGDILEHTEDPIWRDDDDVPQTRYPAPPRTEWRTSALEAEGNWHPVVEDPDFAYAPIVVVGGSLTSEVKLPPRTADIHSGAMVAIRPPDDILGELVATGSVEEDFDNLHITMAYLPEVDDLDKLRECIDVFVKKWHVFGANLQGYGTFIPEDGPKVLYASVDGEQVERCRVALVEHLAAWDFEVGRDHGFTAHLTMAYSDDAVLPDEVPSETFVVDQLIVARADDWTYHEFTMVPETVEGMANRWGPGNYRDLRTLADGREVVFFIEDMSRWDEGDADHWEVTAFERDDTVDHLLGEQLIGRDLDNSIPFSTKREALAYIDELVQGTRTIGMAGWFSREPQPSGPLRCIECGLAHGYLRPGEQQRQTHCRACGSPVQVGAHWMPPASPLEAPLHALDPVDIPLDDLAIAASRREADVEVAPSEQAGFGTFYDEGYADQATDGRPDPRIIESLNDSLDDLTEYAYGVAHANGGVLPDSPAWGAAGLSEDATATAEDLGMLGKQAETDHSYHGESSDTTEPGTPEWYEEQGIPDFERQENQDDPFDGVTLDEDDDGHYVHTHRARSKSYESPESIPDWAIEFIRSTGSVRTAAKVYRGDRVRVTKTPFPAFQDREGVVVHVDAFGPVVQFVGEDGIEFERRLEAPREEVERIETTGSRAVVTEEVEPALPQTFGDEEPEQPEQPEEDEAVLEGDAPEVDESVMAEGARSWLMEGGSGGGSSTDPSNSDIAAQAKQFLAAKTFTAEEQAELISEGGDGKTRARNLDGLDIEGTHYEALERLEDEDEEDHETLWEMF